MQFILLVLPVLTSASVKYTVSGFSGGAFMASQHHVAYSSVVTGTAVIAGGPYYCTEGSYDICNTICAFSNQPVDISPCLSYATTASSQGNIDSLQNLQQSKVFIFSGIFDRTINPPIVRGAYNFYLNYVPKSQIKYIRDAPANHEFPTVFNCGYNGAKNIFEFLIGIEKAEGRTVMSHLFAFNQTDYVDVEQVSMDQEGFVYVPESCQKGPEKCVVHISYHGCYENYQSVGYYYIESTKYMGWAESNNIILIFPQTVTTDLNYNDGCWDYYGYTGLDFALKSAPQMTAANSMAQDYVNLVAKVLKNR